MKLIRAAIPDTITIDPQVHGNARGYVVESFCQGNKSKFSKDILRNLHH